MSYLGGGVALLALLLGVMGWQYRRLRRSREHIRAQSAQLELLMKELHHRIKNNLAIVSSLLNLQAYQLDDDQAARAVREGQQRVEALSLIHQKLYQTDVLTRINVQEYLTNLAESLMHAYGFTAPCFDLELRVDQELLDVDVAIPLGLISNELITNAFKYAYGGMARPKLTIRLTNDNGLTLDVADNGPGLDLHHWHKSDGSFGKQLLESLGEQLGGTWTIHAQPGTHFRPHIPSEHLKTA